MDKELAIKLFESWWDSIEHDYDWEYQSQYSCAKMAYLKAFREGFIEGTKIKTLRDQVHG